MKNILYLGPDNGCNSVKQELESYFKIIHVTSSQEFIENVNCAYAVVDASMRFTFSREVLINAIELKVISCATTGSSHIDSKTLNELGITLHTLKEDGELLKDITPAAELSWALLLACARKLPYAIKDVIEGNWQREKFPGVMLNGKVLGIIGCGRIGTWMSKYAKAFGMQVVGYDPFIDKFPDGINQCTLEELLVRSDFISIHVHLSEETKELINLKRLKMCKETLILINTSRGQVINEPDLLFALQNRIICAAGLDVLTDEPEIEKSQLLKFARNNDNLIITPHCGGNSPDAVKIVCKRAAEKIKMYYLNNKL
jgi:D-3-phosphoglycerate dehydrogenase